MGAFGFRGAAAAMAVGVAVAALSVATGRATADEADLRDDGAAQAFLDDPRYVITGVIENDRLGDGNDRFYTSGLSLQALLPADHTPFLQGDTAGLIFGDGARRLELSVNQILFTPEQLGPSEPVVDERPYGGFFYLGADVTTLRPNRSLYGFEALIEDRAELQIGAVGGDASLGEGLQDAWHDVFGGASPDGYDNGLENEPGVNLILGRAYRVYGDLGPLETEIRPSGELSLGTVLTQASLGLEARFGEDLEYDLSRLDHRTGVGHGGYFGPQDGLAWSVAVGAQARAVPHNVFLDGNVFANGPADEIDIDTERFIFDAHLGAAIATGRVRVSYALVYRSKEYAEQEEPQLFGTLGLGVKF